MNTKKGKGKNRPNKSPNPNPPQKIDVVDTPEKIDKPVLENVDSEIKIEERVPEIVSEVITPSEVKIVEEPKKPKRKRGKKKKHDKEETEETTVENIEEEAKTVSPIMEEKKTEVFKEKTSENPLEDSSVVPTARKKNNKNKNENVDQSQKNIPTIEKTEDALAVKCSDSSDVKRDISPKPMEEIKPSKKKNKKKKRHDSEKSDKGEEVSCTAAFQQLLGVEEVKTESKEIVAEIKAEVISETSPGEKPVTLQSGIADESTSKGNKNKKKGKKDKNNTNKIVTNEELQQPIVSDSIIDSEKKVDIISDIVLDVTAEIEKSKSIIEDPIAEIKSFTKDEEEVKAKAKIARPVDKKRKEKSNQALKESDLPENINVPEYLKTEERVPTPLIDIVYDKKPTPDQSKCEETLNQENTSQLEDVSPASLPELIFLPGSSTGKKRKKSPKPPHKQHEEIAEIEPKNTKVQAKDEFKIESLQEKNAFEQTPKHEIIESPIKVTSEPEFIKEPIHPETTSTTNLEVKSGKKRRKSPKPTMKLEITEKNEPELKTKAEQEIKVTTSAESLDTLIKTEQREEERTDLAFDKPQQEDIEISSVKADESEGSVAEILPDVQYPRAASQQRVDTNNNTIIREVVSPNDVKLGVPIFVPDTPFVQGGNLTLTSPELIASGIRVIDVEANVVKPTEEKTDIRSKMMEVNQDMEELRLSIERSLAELTSIEKTEENKEKEYEHKCTEKDEKLNPESTSEPAVLPGSEAVHEECLATESALNVKKPMEAITLVPYNPPKNKKEKQEKGDIEKTSLPVIPLPPPLPKEELIHVTEEIKLPQAETGPDAPIYPARKDNRGKGKSKKKGKQETGQVSSATNTATSSSSEQQSSKETTQDTKKEEKNDEKSDKTSKNTKKQSDSVDENKNNNKDSSENEASSQLTDFEPIESFEDAMTSSADDVNQTFEMIASESVGSNVNPEINITAPIDDSKADLKDEKKTPVTPPKNLLGHPVIPVRSNKMDYKKEKNKTPNTILAKVKIKDSIEIESKKQSKESQTDSIKKLMNKKSIDESFSALNDNEEFVYKYSFRKVFLPSVCHVCKKDLKPMRVSCNYCHLLYYCNQKHKDEDWPQHQAFCFAVSTIVHLKDQKHLYEDAATITGHNYRLLRMQMIVSCEKILKRKLVPWEQEALLYPRMCGGVQCREWRLNKLADCDGCGQIAYCSSNPDHLPKSHQRWCKSYSLYQKLVCYQQTRGRLEPKLPSRVMTGSYQIPDKINEVLAAMYEEKIDMKDVEYAALTQLATAPLTAAYSFQLYTNNMNSIFANGTYKKTSFTIHVVGAELQFEADALNKWEVFFLHLRPDILELRVSLIAPDLNPSNLPLDLLGKIKLCDQCRQDKRRVLFSFQDKKTYSDYYRSDDFTTPDIVCAFNPSIQRSSAYNGKDTWPATISCILKQKVPFTITSYSIEELRRDLSRVKQCSGFNIIAEPRYNPFASVRPDRNFISDDEIPLLFKNNCVAVISGVF